MTADEIIDGILQREGEGKPPWLAKDDLGGRTSWGISERAHPEMWRNGPPSRAQARALYLAMYVKPFDWLIGIHEDLRVAMIDDGVMSGGVLPGRDGSLMATKRLQAVLGVPIDGKVGPVTIAAVRSMSMRELLQKYCVERVLRLARLVVGNRAQATNLVGWLSRALLFLPKP